MPNLSLSDVGATALTTLHCRALESQSAAPVLHDPAAVAIVRRLQPVLAASASKQLRALARGEVDGPLALYVAMRARHFDRLTRTFLAQHPDGYIVNLGCGFDTRFQRLDDGRLRLFDVDRTEVLASKRTLVLPSDRYHLVEGSVLESAWMAALPSAAGPAMFLAEGLFMYLPEAGIRTLLKTLQQRFPGAQLAAELFDRFWLAPWIRWAVDLRLRRQLHFGPGAGFISGLGDGRELEDWCPGLQVLGEWCWYDDDEPRLGRIRHLGRFDRLRRVLRILHCRL